MKIVHSIHPQIMGCLFSLTTFAQESTPVPASEPGQYVVDLQSKKERAVYPFAVSNKWGLVDETGKTLLTPRYDSIGSFHQNYGVPYANFYHRGKTGILNQAGAVVLPAAAYHGIQHDGYMVFSAGITRVGKKYGLLRQTAKGVVSETLPPHYDRIVPFQGSEHHYAVWQSGRAGIVSARGAWEVPLEYDSCQVAFAGTFTSVVRLFRGNQVFLFSETKPLEDVTGLTTEQIIQRAESANTGPRVMMCESAPMDEAPADGSERVVPSLEFTPANPSGYRVTYTLIGDNGQVRKGDWTNPTYRKLVRFSESPVDSTGRVLIRAQGVAGKWGLIDETGRVVLPLEYDLIKPNIDIWAGEEGFRTWEYALVRRGTQWGAIDMRGRTLLPARFRRVVEAGTYVLFCADATGQKVYWANGKIHLPR